MAGKSIFQAKGRCLDCHSIENRGGSLGPDLTDIGVKRTPASLRLSIMDPNAEIYREYLTVVVTTKQGQQIEGISLNEDDLSIQLREPHGTLRSFLKEDLRDVRREEKSLMPSYAKILSSGEVENLVVYLGSLRGEVEPTSAGSPKRKPGPLTQDTAWLNRANRDSQERPDTLLDSLQIPKGATVADLGAGTGYFTWRLAERVGPNGKVIAVDIQHRMLDLISQDLKKRNLGNVDLIVGAERDPRLREGTLDLVFMANAYHEFSQPEAILAAVRRSLKPNGRLVVVEYATENDDDPTAGVYTMTLQELRSEIEPIGFQLNRVLDFLPMQHGLIFSKEK